MLEFTCDCGRKLKVSNELAGWQTQCPGCQRLVAVPSPEAQERAAEPKAEFTMPWKGIAIGASSVAVILLLILVMSSGGSRPSVEADEAAVARLKKELEESRRQVDALSALKGDLSKANARAKLAEEERDRLRAELVAMTEKANDLKGASPPEAKGADEGAAPSGNRPSSSSGPTDSDYTVLEPEQILERLAGAVVLVTSNRDSGGGFFIQPDGLVVTSYRAVAQSDARTVTYVTGKGEDRARVEAPADVVAIDVKNDLALLKISVPKLVPTVTLEESLAVGGGTEVVALGNPVPGTRSIDHSVIRGKVVDIYAPDRGKKYIETSIPLNTANIGVPIFSLVGRVIGVSTMGGDPSAVAAFAVPSAFVRILVNGRETDFAVRGSVREWEAKRGGKGEASPEAQPPKEHPTGIGVGGVLVRLHLDEERDRMVALDAENACVTVMTLSTRKIARTIPTGPEPADIQWTMNPDVAWVSHPGTRLFLKIDLAEGKVYDRVDWGTRYTRFAATRNHLWTFGEQSHLLPMKDKAPVASPVKFAALTYDRRRDRMIGVVTSWEAPKLVDFAPDKVGPALKEAADIAAGGGRPKELPKLVKALEEQFKTWPMPPGFEDRMPADREIFLKTDGLNRVTLDRFALKLQKMDAVTASFLIPPLPKVGSTPMIAALKRFAHLDQVKAISPDGRWAATGRHVFSLEKGGGLHLEFPVASPDAVFSADSKTVWIYDLGARAAVPLEVEPKETK
ncbi:MAG TPA: trypsin-like peptidase domain-containing protein [Planctomycetota bacterium]|nr:trypsin-like peptidase domain-containing protein [Planctomycetota bacterium]